jgi:DNA-binding CsgD family transcriptional regulator
MEKSIPLGKAAMVEGDLLVIRDKDVSAGRSKVDFPVVKLTEREREVLYWAGQGKSTIEISMILLISPRTVKAHLKKIMGKLETDNRTLMVAEAIRKGILD